MNILFLMKVFEVGGQEKVTAMLAEEFLQHGHNVSIVSFATPHGMIIDGLDSRIDVVDLHSRFRVCKKTVLKIRKLLSKKEIDVIINQWGLPYVPVKVLYKALKSNKETIRKKTRIISVYHNDPQTNARIKEVEISLSECNSLLNRIILKTKWKLYTLVTSRSMRYVYNHSDQYQLLSKSYVTHFEQFTGTDNPEKIVVMTNPVTIDSSGYSYDFHKKEKEIIFCGRIDQNQKRASRLVDVWKILENRFHDWRLTIVGDGIMREPLEQKVRELGLERVSFEGFQDPKEYYKRASILMLVSEYEGFPLVLAEAMSFGVVPAVYFSFSAAADIIIDGKNGILVDKPSDGIFPTEVFAEEMAGLMSDENKLQKMQLGAIEKSNEYSLDNIYTLWENVLNELVSK